MHSTHELQQSTDRSYKYVVFDFDGVLCDNAALAVEAYHLLRDREFHELPSLTSRADLGDVCAGPSREWLHNRLDPASAARFWTQHEQNLGAFAGRMRLFEGIGDVLLDLPPERAAIVTGGRAERIREVLLREMSALPPSLTVIVGGETPGSKTDKVRQICANWGHVNGDTAFIGDTESDVLSAQAVPVDAIAVGYGYQVREQVMRSRPSIYLETPTELARFLRDHVSKHLDALSGFPDCGDKTHSLSMEKFT
ncbi:HAD family hydrolase [Streptomyces noursei]|uniref:HAD family hydrolase n=1 Tax=Streptomyces noursei TaxID=1971 RepID=UPI001676F372|nr:HAD family hydrolase [Streptomyces noursei]MCZ1014861.1 HAD family hydrolase [Streptomyces noursei]